MAFVQKIKDFFKNLDKQKLTKIFVVIICVLICGLSMTFANRILQTWYFIIIPIFLGLILIFTIVFVVLWFWIKKKSKTENDLKIEQVLKQRKLEEAKKIKEV